MTDMGRKKEIECIPLTPQILADEWAEETLTGQIKADPTIIAEQQCLMTTIEWIMNHKLKVRERRVLEERFGLKGGGWRYLEEVGRDFSISRERIRQIEKKALGKLRETLSSRGWSGEMISELYD